MAEALLSAPIQRLHGLRFLTLTELHGFAGEHLKWHEAPARRRAAAKPTFSLLPPPLESVSTIHRHSPRTYRGEHGQPISWTEWRELQMAAWTARESNPEVIDMIGVSETVCLAEARFQGIVPDYLLAWSAETDGDSEKFAQLLEQIRESVTSEISDLWGKSDWHAAWFERACHKKVVNALAAQVTIWKSTARKLEIQHLENPHLSLSAIVKANGDLNIAFELDQGQRVLDRMGSYLEPEPQRTNGPLAPDRSISKEEIFAASSVPKPGPSPSGSEKEIVGTEQLAVKLGQHLQTISIDLSSDCAISNEASLAQNTVTANLSDALSAWYQNGGIDAVSVFADAARALDGIVSVDLSAAFRPILDAAGAIEDIDLTGKGFREALEASACALEGIDVARVSTLFDSAAVATTPTDFDLVRFTGTLQELQNAGALVLKGIDLQDLAQAVAPLTEAARAAYALGTQAQSAVRQLQNSVSTKPPASVREDSSKTPAAVPEIFSPERRETPEMLIGGYLQVHPEIPNYDALAEKIGISRDVLFAIKGQTRWVRPLAYQCTAELIGCPMLALHPRVLVRRRRKGKSNQKSDAKSDQ